MLNRKNTFLFIFINFTFILAACQKQSPSDVLPEEAWQIRDQQRLEACTKVNFTKDLLLHSNSYNLFKCTGWDKKFPSLNRGLQNINPESWNHFFKPIDDAFLNDKQRRDRVFDHIRALDSKQGLDDLSRVITALNETNFYDAIRNIFICSENRNYDNCKGREGKELSKNQIKNLIKIVELKPIVIKSAAIFIKELMSSLGDDAEAFRDEVRSFFYGDDFVNIRLKLVSSFAQKFYQGLTPIEREFFKKIATTRWRDSTEPYLYTWIQKPIFNRAVFKRLTNYAVVENPEILKDLKLLKRGYHYPLYCKPYSESGRIDIDLKTQVDEFLTAVYENEYEAFHGFVIQNVASLQLAISFCPKLKNYSGDITFVEAGQIQRGQHQVNFVDLEKKLIDLTSEVAIFDLSKFATFLTSRNMGDIPPNPGFLIDLATEEITEWIVEIFKVIHASSDKYFDLVFNFLKKSNPLIYDSVGVMINELLLSENEGKMKALSKAWLFLDKTEQNFLFNYIDRHLQEDTNFKLLFNFYATMLEEYAIVSPQFSEDWTRSDESLEKSYKSLFDIVNNFSGKNVLKDFDKFFSRDHIITILKIVTRGPELKRMALNRIDANLINDYISKLPVAPYEVEFTGNDTEYSRRAKACIDSLTENKTLYVLLSNFPKHCDFFKEKEITLQTFSWLAGIQSNYETLYNIPSRSTGTLLDEGGLLSSESLNNSIAILRIIDEDLAFRLGEGSNTGGIKYLLDIGQSHLYKVINDGVEGYKEGIVAFINIFAEFLQEGGDEHRYLRNLKLFEIMADDGPKLEELLIWKSELLEKYSEKIESGELAQKEYVEDVKYSCPSYMNNNIGGFPCPSKERVKRGLRSVVEDLNEKYKKTEGTALGHLLHALIPGYGLSIPLGSKKPRLKRLSVKESVEMVYKLSDKKYAINNLKIKFREDDEYDSKYQVSNWSGLKWRKTKNELSDIDEPKEHVKPEDELIFKTDEVAVTTLERIEIAIRDVRFDMNYLGAHYKNAVAKADDYNYTVEKKLKMFKTCTSLRFCGKLFNKQQIRMAKNTVAAYPGLLDANAIKGFGFGDYIQSLLGIFIRSSSRASQKSALLKVRIFGKKIEVPWVQTKKQLREHNGRVLTKLSMLSGLSNFSRFVRDRMGRSEAEFNKNIESKEMKILNDLLLNGVDPIASEEVVGQLLTIISGENGEDSLLTEFIDWVDNNNYQEQRELEEFVFNVALVSSFLGVGPIKIGYELNDENYERYRDNSLQPLLFIAKNILPNFMRFKGLWPNDFKLIDIIRVLNKPLNFFSAELKNANDLNKNISYKLLNESFLLLNKFLYEETEFSKSGSYYLSNFLARDGVQKRVMNGIKNITNYLNFMERKDPNQKMGYLILSENLSSVVNDTRFDLGKIKNYFLKSTKSKSCLNAQELDCKQNVHYDEPARLLIYGSKKNGSKSTNIERFMDVLFKDHINDYTDMIDNLLPLIRIKPSN